MMNIIGKDHWEELLQHDWGKEPPDSRADNEFGTNTDAEGASESNKQFADELYDFLSELIPEEDD